MAFANLFTGLFLNRDVTDSGAGKRKRGSQAEQRGPAHKKQNDGAQRNWTSNSKTVKGADSTATSYRVSNTEQSRTGFSEDMMQKHSDNAGHKGQQAKQKQQKKQGGGRKNQHHQQDRGRFTHGGGPYQTRKFGGQGQGGKQEFKVPPTRPMTQEFKDQNALLVDGQLLCRHFMWGRCIKGDDCQLKHVTGYNDLIKEACKFYIQGFCTKGESCPYMHNSFPCKFFHRKGKCSNEADCKFSHDPLNETTSRLLEEVLKRQQELYELSKKNEQNSSEQPANTDETEMTESEKTPDVATQLLRPHFYNSGETKTEKEDLCETEEQREVPETAVPPEASDSARPHSPLSAQLSHKEPVCYSVEAMLGSQLFKPFPRFYTTPGSQDSSDLNKPPDSVDPARSCKSAGGLISDHTSPPPTARCVSYTPTKTDCEQLPDPLLSSNTNSILYSPNTSSKGNESQEQKFNGPPPFHTNSALLTKTCPDRTVARREVAASLNPSRRASCQVKSELLSSPAAVAEKSALPIPRVETHRSSHLPVCALPSVNRKSVFPFVPNKLRSQTFNPPQMRPHLSLGLMSTPQPSAKPLGLSSRLSEIKSGAAAPAGPVTSSSKTNDARDSDVHHLATKQPPETPDHSEQPALPPGTEQPPSSEAESSSNTAHPGDSSFGCSKTFYSLFASPITHSPKPTSDLTATSTSFQPSCSTPPPAPSSSDAGPVKPVGEAEQPSARSFLCLFSAPLSAAPPPRTPSSTQEPNQLPVNAAPSSDFNQRASHADTPAPIRTDGEQSSHRAASPYSSPGSRTENHEDLSEAVSQVKPTCRLESDSLSPIPCDEGAESPTTHHRLSGVSSPKGPEVGASSSSVLKTLFLSLSPFVEDGEQRSSAHTPLASGSGKKEQSSTGDGSVKQQQKKKKRKKKKTKVKGIGLQGCQTVNNTGP